MTISNAFTTGFRLTNRSVKLIWWLYGANVLLALMLALPFLGTLRTEAAHTMSLEKSLAGFDFTVFQDFMRESGKAVRTYVSQIKWVVLFYFILSAFFGGGILWRLHHPDERFSVREFFGSCGRFFLRFLLLNLITAIVQLVVALIVYIPLGIILNTISDTVESEKSLVLIGLTGGLIHLLLVVLVLAMGDYARIRLYQRDSFRTFAMFGQAVKFTFRRFGNTYGLIWVLVMLNILLFILYFLADELIGMTSGWTIFIMFFVQQAFIWARVYLKVWRWGSELALYASYAAEETVTSMVAALPTIEQPEGGLVSGEGI